MAVSYKAFLKELYEEHLSDAAFLYRQRLALFADPTIPWRKVGAFENRLEANIDALVVGGEAALDVCAHHTEGDDAAELFAAFAVFCRQDRRNLALTVLERLDPGDAKKASSVADALKFELPASWIQDLLTLLECGDPELTPVLARAFGYRRVACGPHLLAAMKRCSASALPEIVWALGRIAHQPAGGLLLDYLRTEDEPVRSAAALALARIGEPSAVDECLDQVRTKTWARLPLALAGGRRIVPLLAELAGIDGDPDCVMALGLLGDPVSIPVLIPKLADPRTAASAASALQCVTGAGLYETVFVPDELAEDELLDSDREQLSDGKIPGRSDGKPFGSTVTRLSRNAEDWNGWWHANSTRFTPGVRYRNGGPLSPARLIDLLTSENTPHLLRKYCSEELVTRYGKDFGVEIDMPAARQIALLSEASAWSGSNGGAFQEGAWYSTGHRLG
jgi:uncharacterized protein (TIGR02270 family)